MAKRCVACWCDAGRGYGSYVIMPDRRHVRLRTPAAIRHCWGAAQAELAVFSCLLTDLIRIGYENSHVVVYTDSKSVASAGFSHACRKDTVLWALNDAVRRQKKQFRWLRIEWVPREAIVSVLGH